MKFREFNLVFGKQRSRPGIDRSPLGFSIEDRISSGGLQHRRSDNEDLASASKNGETQALASKIETSSKWPKWSSKDGASAPSLRLVFIYIHIILELIYLYISISLFLSLSLLLYIYIYIYIYIHIYIYMYIYNVSLCIYIYIYIILYTYYIYML